MADDQEAFELEDLWGGEVIGGLDPLAIAGGLRAALGQPGPVALEAAKVLGELGRITAGRSAVAPHPKDPRFANDAWQENPVYRRLAQAYLAWGGSMSRLADRVDGDWEEKERARFAVNLLVSAASPTNQLPTNPAALIRAFETGGSSLVRGARNFLKDLRTNRGLPSSVDTSPFVVGETVALTPGAVVYRDDVIELLQYEPTTPTVKARPVVLIPPQINKFWFMDMSPGRSLVEYAVSQGIQMFVISWRNPDPEHGSWSLDTYAAAVERAVATATAITGADAASTISLCAGGITTASLLGHLAASGQRPIVAAAFAVTMLEFSEITNVGMFGSASIAANASKSSSRTGVLDGHGLAVLFAALRPDDMIWRYWVNNYLLGNDPPAFDLLAWNADTTRLPAALHADFLDILRHDALVTPGETKVLGSPVDLGAVDIDVFGVGAQNDHLTPWTTCYRSLLHFGGDKEFVQSSSGHINALVNPPGNPKMWFRTGPPPGAEPAEWEAAGTQHPGSWWERWAEWARERLGEDRKAPARLGSRKYPAMEPAPGTYVHVT
jgi:polyhydroxyalkanoate synthase